MRLRLLDDFYMDKTLEEKLSESPLAVAEHRRRNWLSAIGLVASALLPPVILNQGFLLDFNVLAVPASASDFLSRVESLVPALPTDLPRFDVRFLGWLVVPAYLAWRCVALELRTDGKLKSTEAHHIEHLEHEAALAKQKMRSQNLSEEEADEIQKVLRGVGFARYVAGKMFAARWHQIVASSFWPWFIVSVVLAVAPVAYKGVVPWNYMGAWLAGTLVALAILFRKAWRYDMFGDFWAESDLRRLSSRAERTQQAEGNKQH